ncbi:MAG TPA: serine/threonine-protein kinase, partial [Pirellulaceae bacterium]|nr:serine/threonine-protein kinase [Pirellulaceae bacterium]
RLKVDELCDRFEAAWLEGQSPRVEEFLAAVAPVYRSAALHELLKVDSHYRRKAGDPPSKDEYRERFPGLASEWLREELEPKRAAWASTGGARPTPHATGIVFATIANRDTSGARIAVANDLPRIPGYDVLEMLGRGGMGVVYKARDLLLRRLVALKMISSGMAVGPEMLERFRAEARAVAALQHPHLVQIHEVGEHEGRPYLVFEFMAGGSLDARLGGVPQAPLYSAQLIKKVAKAIQFVHARGFVHRDLKPANILLTGKLSGGEMWCANEVDLPKVGDFGLAKQLEDDDARTRTGAILGTPSYMAPEQADGRVGSIGPTTDVYSLGAILYEMLTGRPPFKASTVLETLDQVRQAEPVALRRIQPNVPRDLETICLK